MKTYSITTAIAYANGAPHLGHAYEALLTDVIARFKRLDGFDVHFMTGMDEHGEKVATTAEKNGMAPQPFTDQIAEKFRKMDGDLNVAYDYFIRTTDRNHYESSQALWKKIADNGDIYLGDYGGWYSVRDEAFFGEDELTTDTSSGKKYAPSGAEVVWKEEPSYFFRLSKYTDKLLDLYKSQPDFIVPDNRRNEIIAFVSQEGGLKDLSISRTSFSWGVPVPGDEKHVMYVWLDALTNYITGVGYPDTGSESFKKYWPADVHVIGKDITRFHAIYWPAFLMSANLALPKKIFAHGFINIEGQKMSKSLGNVLSPNDLIDSFGVDQTRYILMREVPHGQDGNFSQEHAVARVNADLANSLGNLAQRTLSQIHKNCEEKIPQPGDFTADDKKLLEAAQEKLLASMRGHYDKFHVHRAIEDIMRVAYDANAYIDVQAPWTLKKTDIPRMNTVLYVLAEVIRCLAIAIQPITPASAAKLLDQLKIPAGKRDFAAIAEPLAAGTVIDKPEGVFPRIMEEEKKEAAGG
jgi:methionyl-tRNA synthetase